MLTEVISNMKSSLQILQLSQNTFSSVSFEKLVIKIAECGVCSTLQELKLYDSANFDSDESVRKFADILAIAPVLTKCDFREHECNSNREVKFEVQYATEASIGAIVIIDKNTSQEIHRRETNKQED